ncbi:MAG: hypothetical protein ACP5N9_04420 [Candidatus Bilamarchaeum sp.]
MENLLGDVEKLIKEAKYSEALESLLSLPAPEKEPLICAKIGHCYFKLKRFRKAKDYLKKIPKEILETKEYEEAKKELKKVKGFYLAAMIDM